MDIRAGVLSFVGIVLVISIASAATAAEVIGGGAALPVAERVTLILSPDTIKPPRGRSPYTTAFGDVRYKSFAHNATAQVLEIDGVKVTMPLGPFELASGTHHAKVEVKFEGKTWERNVPFDSRPGEALEMRTFQTAEGWFAQVVNPGSGVVVLAPARAAAPTVPAVRAPAVLQLNPSGPAPDHFSQPFPDGARMRVEVEIAEWYEDARAPSIIDVGAHEDDKGGWYFLRLGRMPESAQFASWMLGFDGNKSTLVGNQGVQRDIGTTVVVELVRHDDRVQVLLDGAVVHEAEAGFEPEYWFLRAANVSVTLRVSRVTTDGAR
jgi:hypothetical protein